MPKVNGLSDQAVAQLMELFKREQMRLIPPPIPTQRRRRIYAANEGVPFINESGETVPPYAVMEVVSIDANGIVHITKPSGEPNKTLLINRGSEVFDNYPGVGDYGIKEHLKILINEGAFVYGSMGVKPNEWYCESGREGFFAVDDIAADDELVQGFQVPSAVMVGKTYEAIAKGATGTVRRWFGRSGSEVETTIEFDVKNLYADLEEGVWCHFVRCEEAYYLIAGDCNPD